MSKKADILQQKSPAEFFAENKNIAGFDNVQSSTTCPSLSSSAIRPYSATNGSHCASCDLQICSGNF